MIRSCTCRRRRRRIMDRAGGIMLRIRTPLTAAALVAASLLWSLSGASLAAQQPAPASAPVSAPTVVTERIDHAVLERIRAEGLERSQLAEIAAALTDGTGPRLTGSPGLDRARRWSADRLREWGAHNVRIEPWGEFGRGWEQVSYSGRVLAPFVQQLHAVPLAWTGSTRGTVTGPVVVLEGDGPAELARYRGRLRGAVVLLGAPRPMPPEFERPPLRTPADALLEPAPRRGPPAGPPAAATPEQQAEALQRRQEARQRADRLREVLAAERPLAVLRPSDRPYGILRVGGVAQGRRPGTDPVPELVVAHDQYAMLYRNVQRGVPARVELNVQNRFLDRDLQGYNVLGDIPGSDLAHEHVMLGAHLDSWHAGTGATDNAAGSAVMLEAMRILRALQLQPRRTITIGLWDGEEQGLLGSRGWVENNRELWPRISAYVNVDNGTGRIRGIWDQGNREAGRVFEQILAPFRELGVVAARHGETGSTDHIAFDRAGIPGFNFIQDPIEYSTRTHHTHADTFDRLLLDDLRQAAVVVAATVYHLAMRDELMPRQAATTAAAAAPR
jgi:carboxypeptidase Q